MILSNTDDEMFDITQGKKEKESGTNSKECFPPCRREGLQTTVYVSRIT